MIPLKAVEAKADPKVVAGANRIGFISSVLCAFSPGVSSGAIAGWHRQSEGRFAVYCAEMTLEWMGIILAVYGFQYGSSFLNIELLALNQEPSKILGLVPALALVGYLIASKIVTSKLFKNISDATLKLEIRSASLAVQTLVLFLTAGWVAIPLVLMGVVSQWFLGWVDAPPAVKSFTFLAPMIAS